MNKCHFYAAITEQGSRDSHPGGSRWSRRWVRPSIPYTYTAKVCTQNFVFKYLLSCLTKSSFFKYPPSNIMIYILKVSLQMQWKFSLSPFLLPTSRLTVKKPVYNYLAKFHNVKLLFENVPHFSKNCGDIFSTIPIFKTRIKVLYGLIKSSLTPKVLTDLNL